MKKRLFFSYRKQERHAEKLVIGVSQDQEGLIVIFIVHGAALIR